MSNIRGTESHIKRKSIIMDRETMWCLQMDDLRTEKSNVSIHQLPAPLRSVMPILHSQFHHRRFIKQYIPYILLIMSPMEGSAHKLLPTNKICAKWVSRGFQIVLGHRDVPHNIFGWGTSSKSFCKVSG